MAMVPNGVEILPKISIAWVGCTNVTDRRQTTDGRTTTYSEREREFTFAINYDFLSQAVAINHIALPFTRLKDVTCSRRFTSYNSHWDSRKYHYCHHSIEQGCQHLLLQSRLKQLTVSIRPGWAKTHQAINDNVGCYKFISVIFSPKSWKCDS